MTRPTKAGFFTALAERAGSKDGTVARMSNDGLNVIGTHQRNDSATGILRLNTAPGAVRLATLGTDTDTLPTGAGNTVTYSTYHAAFTAHSRLARLGMGSLLLREPAPPTSAGKNGGLAVMPAEVAGISYIGPADLALVGDGVNVVPVTTLPWKSDTANFSDPADAPRYATSFTLAHADIRKWIEAGTFDDRMLASVLLGLSRLNDQVALAALNLLVPSEGAGADQLSVTMAVAKAAGAKLDASDLGAVIGRNGVGATFNPNKPGELSWMHAVPAVLSDLTVDSWVGAWSQITTVWLPEVNIVASKGLDRSLTLTVGASVVPLIPRGAETFWRSANLPSLTAVV